MREIIIIKENIPKIKTFLDTESINYEIYQEPQKTPKIDIFANYGEVIKNQEREKELKLWDNVDFDEELNNDGEWWS